MISAAEFTLWIENIEAVAWLPSDQFIMLCPSSHARNVVEENYIDHFFNAASYLREPLMSFICICPEELHNFSDFHTPKKEVVTPVKEVNKSQQFRKRYTFDSFVVGDSNRLAVMTARTVSENPGVNDGLLTLNPFYIYGGVGLGKTHLLHAIGNYIEENNPDLKVLYTSADAITNEYFSSLNKYSSDKDSYRAFRDKYSSVDVLMLDDVQALNKKGGMQEVIFNIFNDLYNKGKQIILSSDRPPREINDIEDRLRSRFEGGIMCDIWLPSMDTRIEILTKKLQSTGHNLDRDIIYYIAEKVTSNIRELEGALTRVIMFSILERKNATLDRVKELLKEGDSEISEEIEPDTIIKAVGQYFNFTHAEIIGKKRTKEVVEARMIAIYLVCDMLSMPLMNIGQVFGNRDHTTIMYSRDKITSLLNGSGKYEKIINDIKELLNVNK